jgi:hypothetical protein
LSIGRDSIPADPASPGAASKERRTRAANFAEAPVGWSLAIRGAATGGNTPLRASSDKPLEPKVLRVVRESEATWQQSSFDLAQGLDIKVMKSKHSVETLDRLFGRC